jgi:hypothetical protein
MGIYFTSLNKTWSLEMQFFSVRLFYKVPGVLEHTAEIRVNKKDCLPAYEPSSWTEISELWWLAYEMGHQYYIFLK